MEEFMKRLIFLAGLALIGPTAAFAGSDANLDTCSDDSAVPWKRIQSCTEIISSGAVAKGEALRNRGSAYVDAEKFDLAIADETAAISLNPRDAIAYNLRAWAYLEAGKTGEALVDVNKGLLLDPRSADALDTRGRIYEAEAKLTEAAADFRKALEIDPQHKDSTEALNNLETEK
jgi:tetratricopeptide (TPR) repeat protein